MQELRLSNRVVQNDALLTEKEKTIASFLLENQSEIKDYTITTISKKTNTSNATVSRLMTKLGYSSFGEFKAMVTREESMEEAESDTVSKLTQYYKQIIDSSHELIDSEQLATFVQAIQEARQVMICGIGNSGLSAIELKYRLTRMGIYADALTDPHMSLMRTSLLNQTDMLIVLSHTGQTKAVLDTCQLAKEKGIPIYAVTTNNHTPLTDLADVTLFASKNSIIRDEKFINSQLVTHFVLDIICYKLLENKTLLENRRQTVELVLND